MGWLLCHLGRHAWQHKRNPEIGGRDADYEQCSRCGMEKEMYGQAPPSSIAAGGF
jgi:hypothetical protein